MTHKTEIIIACDSCEFARTGAEIFTSIANEAVKKNGRFVAALSGGATPLSIFRLFANDNYRAKIPWSETYIFWVDERYVSEKDASSNYGRAFETFIGLVPISSGHVHRIYVDLPPEMSALKYEHDLISFFQLENDSTPLFDLMLLGVGQDGHTASLFPGDDSLKEKRRLVLAVEGGNPRIRRITMTLPVLNNTIKTVFIVSGKEKARIMRDIFTGTNNRLPALLINPDKGEVIWLLDHDAASLLHEMVSEIS
jgi:6-phosphogluconolactonase